MSILSPGSPWLLVSGVVVEGWNFIPEIVGFRFSLCMTTFSNNGFQLTPVLVHGEHTVLYASGSKEEKNYICVGELENHCNQSKVEFLTRRKYQNFFPVCYSVLLKV